MAGKQKYTKEQVASALREKRGLITLASELLGCEYQTVYNYARRYKCVQDVIDHFRERRSDVAEYKLDDALEKGEQWAVMFTLSRLGKTRGYAEKQEITHSGDVGVEIKTFDYMEAIEKIKPPGGG